MLQNHTDMMTVILTKLRLLRQERNYSQEYVASQLKISQSYYAKIESGKSELSLKLLFDILEILDLDSVEFHILVKKHAEKILERKVNTTNTFYE